MLLSFYESLTILQRMHYESISWHHASNLMLLS